MKKHQKKTGFTLVEMLVVIAILSIVGLLVLYIFTNSLRGSNKAQILSSIKKNGQAVLEVIDKTVRGADNVVCISLSGDTLVVVKEGKYTRFKFIPPIPGSVNGKIQQDFPKQPPPPASKSDVKVFLNNVCTDPIGTDSDITPQTLTDTNPQTGASIQQSSTDIFTKGTPQAGYKDTITVRFQAASPVGTPPSLVGQIDPVDFSTTVGLR